MKPGLLALDFDGVVCDGIREMCDSAWLALVKIVDGHGTSRSTVTAPSAEPGAELRARFAALRPAIETGWEMVALLGVLTERPASGDAALREHAQWAAVRDAYVKAHGLSTKTVAETFDDARLRWMEKDEHAWLERHEFYGDMAAWLARILAGGQLVYVISTKRKRFVESLLTWQKIALPSERIIGRAEPKREKWDVLKERAAAHGVAARDVWFVEDRLQTLLDMRRHAADFDARLFLAEWGYIFRDRDPAAARAAGIPVLTLAQATGPFDGWQ